MVTGECLGHMCSRKRVAHQHCSEALVPDKIAPPQGPCLDPFVCVYFLGDGGGVLMGRALFVLCFIAIRRANRPHNRVTETFNQTKPAPIFFFFGIIS